MRHIAEDFMDPILNKSTCHSSDPSTPKKISQKWKKRGLNVNSIA